jgi:cardiolipin synthase
MADWSRQEFDAGENARLVWCPGNGRERICHFIDDARNTLFVQNERYQDTVVIESWSKVSVVCASSTTWA